MAQYSLIAYVYVIIIVLTVSATEVLRQKRFFVNDIETIMKIKTAVVTSVVPSSCIKISPTLLPCRNIRSLTRKKKFFSSYVDSFLGLDEPETENIQRNQDEDIEENSSVQSWAEYFGIISPTTTITSTYYFTTTVIDPRVTVTFSIRGCKPSRLPFNLPLCSIEIDQIPILEGKSENSTEQPGTNFNRNIESSEISPTASELDSSVQQTKSI